MLRLRIDHYMSNMTMSDTAETAMTAPTETAMTAPTTSPSSAAEATIAGGIMDHFDMKLVEVYPPHGPFPMIVLQKGRWMWKKDEDDGYDTSEVQVVVVDHDCCWALPGGAALRWIRPSSLPSCGPWYEFGGGGPFGPGRARFC
jgi:hypothetical protein